LNGRVAKNSTIRVFVVDDHPFFRTGVVFWLSRQPDIFCCGEAGSIEEARKLVPAAKPDVVLLDLQLGDGSGLDFIPELGETAPTVRIVVLSHSEEDVFAHRALRAGARGYLMKCEATEAVSAAIHTVMEGQIYVSRRVSARMLQNLFPDPADSYPDLARLSDRELQVFQLMGAGCRHAEIAKKLKISPKTVDTYRENLKQKLHLRDVDALMRAAVRWVQRGEFASPKKGK